MSPVDVSYWCSTLETRRKNPSSQIEYLEDEKDQGEVSESRYMVAGSHQVEPNRSSG